MKIGLDFDGVISDCYELKSRVINDLFGISVPPETCKREILVAEGLLTDAQYDYLQEQAYGTRRRGLSMKPVDGIAEYLPKLNGHEIIIISSRSNTMAEVAKEWMRTFDLNYRFIPVGRGVAKADACKGLEVYVDDDLDKIIGVTKVVPHGYLFSWKCNEHLKVNPPIERVSSWNDLYTKITSLIH